MIFRLYFTGDQWYQTRFHGFIGYLYLFLVNLKNLCLFKNWCFLIIINFKVFFLKYSQDLSYLSYIYIYRACLLPVCGLPFCFLNCFWRGEAFKFSEVQHTSFFFHDLCFWSLKKFLPTAELWRFCLLFYSRSFTVFLYLGL